MYSESEPVWCSNCRIHPFLRREKETKILPLTAEAAVAAARAGHRLLSELICSVCLDYFEDPVCLDCGHNFCRACITQCWQGLSTNICCPECRETFSQRNLKPNRQLRNIVEASRQLTMEPKKKPKVERVCEKHKEGFKIFCQKDQIPICVVCQVSRDHRGHTVVPIDEAAEDCKDQIQSSLKIFKEERDKIQSFKLSGEKKSQELLKQLETDKQKIVSEFEQLSKFLKEQKQLLLAQLEELKKEIEKRRDEYIAKLYSELSSVRSLISEMEQKCQQPAIEFLQDITGTLRRCEREKFQNPVVFSSELKWKIWESSQRMASLDVVMKIVVKTFRDTLASREQLNKANVTLDPDTAHPQLVLSEDRRHVKWERRQQRLPDTPERFDTVHYVLGHERFTSGCHYWEVEVEGGRIWAVGVARESVSRKGRVDFSPEQGVWAVAGRGDQCWACISPGKRINLPQGQAPRRVRVFLDCEGGRVAFYNAGSGESIITFPPAPFTRERIRPIFHCVGSEISLCTHPPRSLCAPEVPAPPS